MPANREGRSVGPETGGGDPGAAQIWQEAHEARATLQHREESALGEGGIDESTGFNRQEQGPAEVSVREVDGLRRQPMRPFQLRLVNCTT